MNGQELSLIDCRKTLLGNVLLDREDGLWHSGPFEPLPEFATIEPLFREWVEAVNQQLFTHVDELDARIDQMGLRLVTDRGEVLPGVQSIQIGEGRLSFRMDKMHLNDGLNGPTRVPSRIIAAK